MCENGKHLVAKGFSASIYPPFNSGPLKNKPQASVARELENGALYPKETAQSITQNVSL